MESPPRPHRTSLRLMGSRASPAQAYSVAEDEEVEEEEDAEDADALRSGEACRPPEEEAFGEAPLPALAALALPPALAFFLPVGTGEGVGEGGTAAAAAEAISGADGATTGRERSTVEGSRVGPWGDASSSFTMWAMATEARASRGQKEGAAATEEAEAEAETEAEAPVADGTGGRLPPVARPTSSSDG